MEQVRKFLKKAINIISRPYMRILPGQLAFFCIMSLIPLLALIGAIANYFSLSFDSIKEITDFLPIDIFNLFTSNIYGEGLNFNIVVFFVSTFLLASNGTYSVIITANEIYNCHDEDIISKRIKAIAMTFVFVGLFFFLLAVTVFGDYFFQFLSQISLNKKAVTFIYSCFNYLKVPLSIVLIYFNIKGLYKMLPNKELSNKSTTYAALFTTIVWIIGTEIYSIYFKFFSNYNLFYGSISNIIMLMVWVYFLAYVFVLGMALSATYDIDNS